MLTRENRYAVSLSKKELYSTLLNPESTKKKWNQAGLLTCFVRAVFPLFLAVTLLGCTD